MILLFLYSACLLLRSFFLLGHVLNRFYPVQNLPCDHSVRPFATDVRVQFHRRSGVLGQYIVCVFGATCDSVESSARHWIDFFCFAYLIFFKSGNTYFNSNKPYVTMPYAVNIKSTEKRLQYFFSVAML